MPMVKPLHKGFKILSTVAVNVLGLPHYAFPKGKVPSNNEWTSPADSSDWLSVYMPFLWGWRILNKLFDVLGAFFFCQYMF
jgi:hypothetical protein